MDNLMLFYPLIVLLFFIFFDVRNRKKRPAPPPQQPADRQTQLPEEWQKTLAGVDKVRAALEDAGMLPEIGYIEIGEEQSYKAVYQDRIQLRLGSEYDLATKLLTAQKIIQDELPADFIGYLDASVSGRAYTRQLPLTQVADAQYLAILGGKQ